MELRGLSYRSHSTAGDSDSEGHSPGTGRGGKSKIWDFKPLATSESASPA